MNSPEQTPDDQATFNRLGALFHDCRARGCNDYDIAVVMIPACISEGINAGRRITGVLEHLGLNKQFVGMTLTKEAGTDPERHRWYRSEDDGLYALHGATN